MSGCIMEKTNNLYDFLYNFITPDFKGKPFEPFSAIHIITLILLALVNFLIINHYRIYKKQTRKKNKAELLELELKKSSKKFRYTLALFLILNEAAYTVWSIATGDWTIGYSLPLHLCDMAMFFSVIMLITKNYFLYEITYFWGLGGSLQALITPDLYPYSFPHFIYFNFFLAHSFVITAVLFMTFVEGFRPSKKSILKTIIFTNLYMIVIAVVNILTNGNYLFLRHKPNAPSIIDYLGPWPWYILGLEAVGVVIMFILYVPHSEMLKHIRIKSSINKDN